MTPPVKASETCLILGRTETAHVPRKTPGACLSNPGAEIGYCAQKGSLDVRGHQDPGQRVSSWPARPAASIIKVFSTSNVLMYLCPHFT